MRGVRVTQIAPLIGGITENQRKPLTGVLFHLPKTVVAVTVDAEATTETPGELCDLRPLYFPDVSDDVKCPALEAGKFWFERGADERKKYIQDNNKKSEVKGYSVATRGIPDPERAFVVPIAETAWADATDSVDVDEAGVISGAEGARTDRQRRRYLLAGPLGAAGRCFGSAPLHIHGAQPDCPCGRPVR